MGRGGSSPAALASARAPGQAPLLQELSPPSFPGAADPPTHLFYSGVCVPTPAMTCVTPRALSCGWTGLSLLLLVSCFLAFKAFVQALQVQTPGRVFSGERPGLRASSKEVGPRAPSQMWPPKSPELPGMDLPVSPGGGLAPRSLKLPTQGHLQRSRKSGGPLYDCLALLTQVTGSPHSWCVPVGLPDGPEGL